MTRMSASWLETAGFWTVGYWELDPLGGLYFGNQIPSDPGVYAVIENGEVRYVGSAQGGLHRRFLKYRSSTNKGKVALRLREHIAQALKNGSEVGVMLATPP